MILMLAHVLLIYSKQIVSLLSDDLFCSAILYCTVHKGFKSRQLWVSLRPGLRPEMPVMYDEERWHQHRYLTTLSDEILFMSDIIWPCASVHRLDAYKNMSSPDVI